MTSFAKRVFVAGATAAAVFLSTMAASAYSKKETTITMETPIEQIGGLTPKQLLPENAEFRIGSDPVLTEYTEHRVKFRLLFGELLDPVSERGLILDISDNAEEAAGIKGTFERNKDNPDFGPGGEPGLRVFQSSGYPCIVNNGIFAVAAYCVMGDLIYFFSGGLKAPGGSAEMDKAVEEISAYADTFPLEAVATAYRKSQE